MVYRSNGRPVKPNQKNRIQHFHFSVFTVTFAEILSKMAVTRLERKARRNKSRAKVRVANLKRFQTRVYVESPNKGESGVVLDVEDPFATLNETASKAKKKKAEPAAKAEVEAPAAEVVEVETEAAEPVAEASEEAPEAKAEEADDAEGEPAEAEA